MENILSSWNYRLPCFPGLLCKPIIFLRLRSGGWGVGVGGLFSFKSLTGCLSGGIVVVIDSFPECVNDKLAPGGLAEPLPNT